MSPHMQTLQIQAAAGQTALASSSRGTTDDRELQAVIRRAGTSAQPCASNNVAAIAAEGVLPMPVMSQLALRLQRDEQGAWLLELPCGQRRLASIALSCHLRPQPHDLVLAAVSAEQAWVIAVLQRDEPNASIELDFGARALHIKAQDLTLQAAQSLQLQSQTLLSNSEQSTELAVNRLSIIKGDDTTQAASMRLQVKRDMSLHANLTQITADTLIKVDGAQIHMG